MIPLFELETPTELTSSMKFLIKNGFSSPLDASWSVKAQGKMW